MTIRIAAKRLSRVEVSADASHQHEIHANALRRALDLPESRTSGKLDVTYVTDASGEAEGETCRYTISNVRRDKPRSPEFHLYYDSRQFQTIAREGDVLVLLRPGSGLDLRALVVREATPLGSQVSELLAKDGVEITTRFKAIAARVRGMDAAEFFRTAGDPSVIPGPEDFLIVADESFVREAITAGRLPATKAMAEEAATVVERLHRGDLDPDLFLQWRLDAETALFQHIEQAVGQRALDDLEKAGSLDFAKVTSMVLKRLQSRKSRRGQSLQNHFAALLTREHIPFTEQCTTEHGEKPDFIIPGCAQYHDPGFPDDRLRMVACKSKVRERWDEILNEADRVPEKYLLTLDSALTDARIAQMVRKEVVLFIPDGIAGPAYRRHANRHIVHPVRELVSQLSSLATGK